MMSIPFCQIPLEAGRIPVIEKVGFITCCSFGRMLTMGNSITGFGFWLSTWLGGAGFCESGVCSGLNAVRKQG